MVNGSRYYRALESISVASALSSALTIYPCQIRVHQPADSLNSNFLQLGRRSGGRPQRTVYPRWPVNNVIHTTLADIEPTTFRLLVRRATSSATGSPKCFCVQTTRLVRGSQWRTDEWSLDRRHWRYRGEVWTGQKGTRWSREDHAQGIQKELPYGMLHWRKHLLVMSQAVVQ